MLADVDEEIDALLSGVPKLNVQPSDKAGGAANGGNCDLLGLSLDDEFSDFMSAPAPFLPSMLLGNSSLVDDTFDFPLPDASNSPVAPAPDGISEAKLRSERATDIFSSLLHGFSKPGNQQQISGGNQGNAVAATATGGSVDGGSKPKSKEDTKTGKRDLSGWYQLFAELDPLSNPDAIPSKTDAPVNSMAA